MQIQPYTSKYNTYQNNLLKNKPQYMTSAPLMKDQVSFEGRIPSLPEVLAKGMGSLGAKKPVQRLVDYLKEKNYQQHLAAFVSAVLSSFYMIDTARSKKIEKDQKMPLIVNQAAVFALSTIGAYTLDNYLDKHIANFTEKFNIANMSDPKTREMFVKLYDNPEYLQTLKRRINNMPGEEKAFEKLSNIVTDELFNSSEKVEEKLKNFLKSENTDNIAKSVLDKIEKLNKTQNTSADKANEAKKLFLNEINSSKTLRDIYKDISKKYIETLDINTIENQEARKVFQKMKLQPEYIENVLRVNQLKKSFEILDKMFEYNKGVDTKLKKLVKEGKADEAVKELIEQVSKLPKKLTNEKGITIDKADKAKELFMKTMSKSKQMTEIFNKQSLNNGIKLVSNNDTKLSTLMNGFKIGKSLMVFAMIYRFVSPVFATPIANSISGKVEKRKKANVH